MAELITMPRLSDTMEEGTVVKWHKKLGDKVSEGDLLAEIETDKAVQEFESEYDGYLLHLGVPEGHSVTVNSTLAIIGQRDEDILALLSNIASSDEKLPTTTKIEENKITSIYQDKNFHKDLKIITMPRLSDTMEEGTVVKWHKKLGDKVSEGDLLAEVETDKAVQEFESEYDGYLLHLGVPEGHSVTVNSTLAIIGPKGTEVKSILTSLKARDSGTQDQVYTLSLDKDNISIENRVTNAQARILASPLAKKIAKERSISLSEIKGSGENGRIIKRDIEKYQLYSLPESQDLKYLPKRIPIPCRYTSQAREVPNSSMRKVIAKRLSESKFIAPHYYLIIEVDMQNAIASREAINASIKEGKISFNDMVIKASAMALRKHPQINTSWKEDKIIYHNDINIGVAVAIEKYGLLVPVIAGADYKSLREISFEVKDKATRARSSKLKIEEMNGSTFTISNLGMFGIEMFTSIINQPNSSILSVGAILEKPIVKNSQIIPGNLMKLSLACDHRTIDGAIASEYLQSLKRFLENPVIMIA